MFCYILFGFILTKILMGYLKYDPYYCNNNTLYDSTADPIRIDNLTNQLLSSEFSETNDTSPTRHLWSIRPNPKDIPTTQRDKQSSGYDERFPLSNDIDDERIREYIKKKKMLEKLERGETDDRDVADFLGKLGNIDIRGFQLFIQNAVENEENLF